VEKNAAYIAQVFIRFL